MTVDIGLGGAYGRMGDMIRDLVDDHDGIAVAVTFDPDDRSDYDAVDEYEGDLSDVVDVYVDFTAADAVLENVGAAARDGVDSVVGTTGWYDRTDDVEQLAQEYGCRVLYGSNFSPGVNELFAETRETAQELDDGWDAGVVECHHTGKDDAPSGTAITLYDILDEHLWDDSPAREDKVGSTRVGNVPGEHTVTFRHEDGTRKKTLEHASIGKEEFAAGALDAVEWVTQQSSLAPGLYEYHDDVFQGQ